MTQTKNRGVSCSGAVFIRCSALNRGVVHVWQQAGLEQDRARARLLSGLR